MTSSTLFAEPPPATQELRLRDHQAEFLDVCRAEFRRHRRILAVAPTGFGKSEVAAEILRVSSLGRGNPTVFVVHRRGLVEQFSHRLSRYSIPHGILMAGHPYELHQPIQVASIDTLDSRYYREGAEGDPTTLPAWRLIIIDEAHTRFDSFKRMIEHHPTAYVLGLTATPALTDGRGLGGIYQALTASVSVRWLIDNDWLVEPRYYGPEEYDYSSVRIGANGEYVEASADEVVDQPHLIGNVIEQYARLGENRPFVVFANSVPHSKHLEQAFNAAGYSCLHIDANTSQDVREAAYAALEHGELLGLSNYGILDRGFDAPVVSVCILARKVRHVTTYRQMVGRVLRTHPKKPNCIVIDHGGNVAMHGFVDAEIEWTLDPEVDVNERERRKRERNPEERPITCKQCGTIYSGSRRCPSCGHEAPKRQARAQAAEYIEGDLAEITEAGAKRRQWTMKEKRQWYAELLGWCERHGKKPGFAAHTYRARFGVWPHKKQGVRPATPSREVNAYVVSRLIAYAKQQGGNHAT